MRSAGLLPPLLWMGVLAVLSGGAFGADRLGPLILGLLARLLPAADPDTLHLLHVGLRKLGHLVDYAILGALWQRALAPGWGGARARPAGWAVVLSVAYAALDEWRQGFAPNRTPALLDVLIDAAGAGLGVASQVTASSALGPAALRAGRGLALALAALSLAAALADRALGLAGEDLLAAALGLLLLALGLGRLARRWSAREAAGYDRATPP